MGGNTINPHRKTDRTDHLTLGRDGFAPASAGAKPQRVGHETADTYSAHAGSAVSTHKEDVLPLVVIAAGGLLSAGGGLLVGGMATSKGVQFPLPNLDLDRLKHRGVIEQWILGAPDSVKKTADDKKALRQGFTKWLDNNPFTFAKKSKITDALKKAGWQLKSQNGPHEKWVKPPFRPIAVPKGSSGKEIPIGTCKSIAKAAGVDIPC